MHRWPKDGDRAAALNAVFECIGEPSTLLEVGSWLGAGARWFAERLPRATIYCVDHWLGSPVHLLTPHRDRRLLPTLWGDFQANVAEFGGRVHPVRMDSLRGMDHLATGGVRPNLIYIDASHQYGDCLADINKAMQLFPGAVIVGDDWSWRNYVPGHEGEMSVRAAVTAVGCPVELPAGQDRVWWLLVCNWTNPFRTCDCVHNCGHGGSMHSYQRVYEHVLNVIKPRLVFEWGPGLNSELALAAGASVVAVEQDARYVPKLDPMKFRCQLVPATDAAYPSLHGTSNADIYFIDSRRRAECLAAVRRGAKPEALVCLHDAQRERYHKALRRFHHVRFLERGLCVASQSRVKVEACT